MEPCTVTNKDRYADNTCIDKGNRSSSELEPVEVRAMLSELSGTPLPSGSSWDGDAIERMKVFQASEGLPRTGMMDNVTVERLLKRYDVVLRGRTETQNQSPNAEALDHVLSFVHSAVHAAEHVAKELAHDGPLRAQYMREVKEFSDGIIDAFKLGKISEGEAARLASTFRNQAMNETRAGLSPAGKVLSSFLKSEGKTLAQLVEKYSIEYAAKAKTTVAKLTAEDKGKVFMMVAERSGVTSNTVNVGSKFAPHAGKALLAVGVAIAIYQVWTAENPEREAVKQGAGFAGFALGATAGLFCGPGAPVCSVVFGLAGGLLGAFAAEHLAEKAYDHGVYYNPLNQIKG
jgi:hypothetical protein